MPTFDSAKSLEKEVLQLFTLVQKMREELAAVRGDDADGKFLDTAADQLNAIAHETEAATQSILSAAEKITETNSTLGSEIKYSGARPHFETIETATQAITEACKIQDVIGQRIANIVRTINTLEGTLNSLVVTLGDNSVAGVSSTLDQLGKADGMNDLLSKKKDG